jgi:hypothetical protein
MNNRQLGILCTCVLAGCVMVGWLSGPLSFAQTLPKAAASVTPWRGRFELIRPSNNELILLDNVTGRCWQYAGIRVDPDNRKHHEWLDLDTPPSRGEGH